MQLFTTGESYSGIGPSSFNKRQLLEIIKMRQKAGRKTRRNYTVATLEQTSRETLVNEAKRVRAPRRWVDYYFNDKIMQHKVA